MRMIFSENRFALFRTCAEGGSRERGRAGSCRLQADDARRNGSAPRRATFRKAGTSISASARRLLVADYVPTEREVVFQSENGILGMGPAPAPDKINRWLINAGKQYVTLRTGGSYMHHADSFALIRGGHLDLCVLGAFQVAENGDIANWATSENDTAPAVGGAMDLAAGAPRIWVLMEHTTKTGESRLVRRCSYPLTAVGVRQAHLHQSRACSTSRTTDLPCAKWCPG